MRKEIADYVLPVFRSAIEYKEGLRTNENVWRPRFSECQKKLMALLQAPVQDDLRNDVLGDPRSYDGGRGGFLGIRYALACWLDEIFILDSPWRDQWNVNSLESTLYKSRERATEFWTQSQRAQTRPTWDALEVYYLCVMLGFRGEMIEKPAELSAWRDGIQSQITQAEGRIYTAPAGLTVQPDVHRPLTGAAKMQKWSMFVAVIVLAFIPVLIFVFAR